MEVLIPHSSLPSTPKRFGDCFFSAPTSPRRSSEFYKKADGFSAPVSAIPFKWQEKPGTPKSTKPNTTHENDDFAFDVIEETERTILPAEELFHCGKIKVRSEMKDSRIQNIRAAFSPRKKKEFDPFGKVVENTQKCRENERGRERVSSLSSANSGRRGGARSVSPYRVSKYSWEEEQKTTENTSIVSESQTLSSSSSSKSKRKWRLKDFFLFRSASEGRSLRKYTSSFWRNNLQDHVKNSSFRSVEGSVSGSGSGLKRRGGQLVSAHELHYTVNRAVSEDLKKKTFLPYKQGILGRLAFNPAVHALANGFGFGLSNK